MKMNIEWNLFYLDLDKVIVFRLSSFEIYVNLLRIHEFIFRMIHIYLFRFYDVSMLSVISFCVIVQVSKMFLARRGARNKRLKCMKTKLNWPNWKDPFVTFRKI